MKILILANAGIGVFKFRKELILKLIQENQVIVSVPRDGYTDQIRALGCAVMDISMNRRGKNILQELKTICSYYRLLKKEKPDVVLTYTVKPNIYGGIICRFLKIPYLANVTGLGTSLEKDNFISKVVQGLYKRGLRNAKCVFFQNKSNMDVFTEKKIVRGRRRLISGSGVNVEDFREEEYPDASAGIEFVFIARMMRDKGIDELIVALTQIKKKYRDVIFNFVGDVDEKEYAEKLEQLASEGLIKYFGQQKDVRPIIKRSHALILPSYHEGLANVLLEAAAMGRPVIASRIPGCQEAFEERVTGLGVEKKNSRDLEAVIEKFILMPYENKKVMGQRGREKMVREFNRDNIIKAYLEEIYSI